MSSFISVCGYKNDLGFFDTKSKEIVLKRPCFKKKETAEVFAWLDEAQAKGLLRFVMGIGPIEGFVTESSINDIYSSARVIVKKAVEVTKPSDIAVLTEVLTRVAKCKKLRFLSLRCFSFEGQTQLFELLVNTIQDLSYLRQLDLTGCYFTDDQLIELARCISLSHIACLIWPEANMKGDLLKEVIELFSKCESVVAMRGVPLELQCIAQNNRNAFLKLVKRPLELTDVETEKVKEFGDSIRLTLSYEQQRLLDIQKTVEAILI